MTYKVVCVLDEFSYDCFKYECDLIQLHIGSWKKTILEEKPDMLLVESAWKGLDNSWESKVRWLNRIKDTNMKKLVQFCRQKNIPTVFWNKEDPFHFDKFLNTGILFDHVFTTSVECIQKYKKAYGHRRIHLLQFAAQPKIHNPMGKYEDKKGQIGFAGTWYSKRYPERKKSLGMLLSAAERYSLDIYDRMYHTPYPQKSAYEFPKEFRKHILPSLKYEDIVQAYKKYDIFLNVNSSTNSRSMFSRRVFELLACGTPVVSNYARGIEVLFPDIVKLVGEKEECEEYLKTLMEDSENMGKISLMGQREVFEKHTYHLRFNELLEKIGFKKENRVVEGVSIISFVEDMEGVEKAIHMFNSQKYSDKELVILKGKGLREEELEKKVSQNKNIKIIEGNHKNFREKVQGAITGASYKYVSFFSPNDYYCEHFIGDLMNGFQYFTGDIVGKGCYFHIDSDGIMQISELMEEYREGSILNPNAMIIKKEVFSRISLKCAESELYWIEFFKECWHKKVLSFSSDRFNYIKNSGACEKFKDERIKEYIKKVKV